MPRLPKLIDPTSPELDIASAIAGNRTKAVIVRYLWRRDRATARELVDEVDGLQGTLSAAMLQLEEWGVVTADVPPADRHGRVVTYTLHRDRVTELIDGLCDFMMPATITTSEEVTSSRPPVASLAASGLV